MTRRARVVATLLAVVVSVAIGTGVASAGVGAHSTGWVGVSRVTFLNYPATATVGALYTDPLQVQVRDRAGHPVPDVRIRWQPAAGSGWVFPTASTTASNGIAQTQWVAGAAKSQRITAIVAADPSQRATLTVGSVATPTQANSNHVRVSPPAGTSGIQTTIRPLTDPHYTYYAAIGWADGYTGIQRTGDLYNYEVLFSIFDQNTKAVVIGHSVSRCDPFGGEGTGFKCRFSYHWRPGGAYRFTLHTAPGNLAGTTNYTMDFTDLTTGKTIKVATIRGDTVALGGPFSIYGFVEDFGPTSSSCLATSYRAVDFQQVRALKDGRWTSLPTATFDHYYPLTRCANLSFTRQTGGLQLTTGGSVVGDPAAPRTLPFPPVRPYRAASTTAAR